MEYAWRVPLRPDNTGASWSYPNDGGWFCPSHRGMAVCVGEYPEDLLSACQQDGSPLPASFLPLQPGGHYRLAGGRICVAGPLEDGQWHLMACGGAKVCHSDRLTSHTKYGTAALAVVADVTPLPNQQETASMSSKADQLRAQVAALGAAGICAKGLAAVTALVETITGERLAPEPPAPAPKQGEVWEVDGAAYLVANLGNGKQQFVNLEDGGAWVFGSLWGSSEYGRDRSVRKAASLAAFLAAGGVVR